MNTFDYSAIDSQWTLFLDRDGVINRLIPGDYVKSVHEFKFLPGVFEALKYLGEKFGTIVVVTNQQGVGKGVMDEKDLHIIHQYMLDQIHLNEGRIDDVFSCTELASHFPFSRKPNIGMAISAKASFKNIDFTRSMIVGDSPSDMEFGRRLGMCCVRIGDDPINNSFESLYDFSVHLRLCS